MQACSIFGNRNLRMNAPSRRDALATGRFVRTFLSVVKSCKTSYLLLLIPLSIIFTSHLVFNLATTPRTYGTYMYDQSLTQQFLKDTCILLERTDVQFLSPPQIRTCLFVSTPESPPQICSESKIMSALDDLLLALSYMRHVFIDIPRFSLHIVEIDSFMTEATKLDVLRHSNPPYSRLVELVRAACGVATATIGLHQRVLEWELRRLFACTTRFYQIVALVMIVYLGIGTCRCVWQKWMCEATTLRRCLQSGRSVKSSHVIRSAQPWCVFCLDDLHSGLLVTTKCSHRFHDECLRRWLLKKHMCPVCRAPMITSLSKVNGSADNTT